MQKILAITLVVFGFAFAPITWACGNGTQDRCADSVKATTKNKKAKRTTTNQPSPSAAVEAGICNGANALDGKCTPPLKPN